ncbi:unnamed protein product [Protopolystoma xenopodis]|uniref:Uncharacterized protein n=1 Tax=Protopolystoma xenopodis TaxID=117903 RepID=A0A448XS79_9PLAT|nr:unnamed protein product [Protopolystoma xenopodis]
MKRTPVHGERRIAYLPVWRRACCLASLRVPLTPAMWHYLLRGFAGRVFDEPPRPEKTAGRSSKAAPDGVEVGLGEPLRRSTGLPGLTADLGRRLAGDAREPLVQLRFIREWLSRLEVGST